ncbi:hypothetical protein V8E52_006294 [Russula decolorans]
MPPLLSSPPFALPHPSPSLGIGILSRLLVEYDAKNLPAHLRALVKTSVHSDRALGKLEAGFITDPFYTIDLMQGSVKSNALPEEAWAVVNHQIATQSTSDGFTDVLKQLAREFNITYTAFGSEISTEDGPTAGTLTLTEAWGTPLEPAPITPFGAPVPVMTSGWMPRYNMIFGR